MADRKKANNFPPTAENLEDKSLNFKESLVAMAENFGSQPLSYIEGFISRRVVIDSFNEMLDALALYEIKSRELYKEAGYESFADYCEAKGISKSNGYEWAKHVETVGPENFPILAEKVGLNYRFFRAFALIPQEIQHAVIKGDAIEIDGKVYDFSGNGDSVKNLVISLVKHLEKVKSEAQERLSVLQTQIKNDARRIKNLEMQIPKKDDDSWATDSIARIHQQLDYFLNELNAFAFNPLVVGNGNIKAKVEGLYQTGYRAFLEFIDKWESYTGHKVR